MNKYTRWQIVIFAAIFCGYATYCLNRKSFTYLLSFIVADTNLDKKDLGIVTSSITLSYAFSKFFSSIISDSLSARLQFSVGLVIVGLSALQFASSDTITLFAAVYFFNGLGQGSGWPPCVKLLKQWFSPSQLGFLWSALSASGNVAGIIGPLVLPYLAQHYGWKNAMWCAGVAAITMACITMVTIKNSPADVGLVFNPQGETKQDAARSSKNEQKSEAKRTKPDEKKAEKIVGKRGHNGKQIPDDKSRKRDVLSSPFLWVLSFLSFIIQFVACSCVDWSQLYLVQEKGFPVAIGSTFLSVHAIGAAFGSISAGYVSDRMVAKYGILQRGSARYSLVTSMVVVELITMHCFTTYVTRDTSLAFLHFLAVLLGACQFSAFALYGVMVVEHTPTHLTGTSHGIAALFANLGGVMAGYPMSYLSKHYNWSTVFLCVEMATLVGLVTLLLTRNIKSSIGSRTKDHKD